MSKSIRHERRIPELLIALNNIGATHPSRALSLKEIADRLRMNIEELEEKLNELLKIGYIGKIKIDEKEKFFLTPVGILVALSVYS